MDSEIQKQFDELDQRLRQAERQILATGNLVSKAGIPFLVNTQMRLDALEESHARLYGALQQFVEQTTAAHTSLAATVQAFIDSMLRGGNGSNPESVNAARAR